MTNSEKKIEELFNAGCHLGHKKNRVHPQARKYIYSFENGVSIIDLEKTAELLGKAKQFINQLVKNNKTLLFVSTKKVSLNLINSLCQSNNIPYVTLKWPAGLLTNFEMIMKNVKKLLTMKEEKEKGEWNKFVKHEQIKLQKKLFKLEKFYSGIIALKKLPDALFVIDIKKEKNAVKEAAEMGIPIIAICDTNVSSATVDYPIPANDDSASSVEYLVKEIVEAYTKVKSQNSKVKNES